MQLPSLRFALCALLLPPLATVVPAQGVSLVPGLLRRLDWEVHYDHGIAGHDSFRALDVDSDGSVLVAGQSLGTWFSWRTEYTYEITTQKYARGGALLWERRYDSPGHGGFDDQAMDVLVRPDDSVVVLGQGQLVSGDQDVVLLCYDALGNELWTRHLSQYWNDSAVALARAADGSLYVLASLNYGAANYDIALLKCSANGDLLWTSHWHGGVSTDYGVGLALDPSGNVTVAGNAWGGSNYDWVALEYDPSGNLLWSARRGPGTCYGFHLDAAGDAVLAGSSAGGFTTTKFSGAGAWLWTQSFAGGTGTSMALASDAAGNLFVCGGANVVSYDAAGTQRWLRPFVAPAGTPGTATSLVLDGSGHVIVSGSYFSLVGLGSQVLVAAYGSAGRLLAVQEHGGTAAAGALALGQNGALYVAGNGPNAHDNDGLLLRY